jgi:hypothetical protein
MVCHQPLPKLDGKMFVFVPGRMGPGGAGNIVLNLLQGSTTMQINYIHLCTTVI